MLPNCSLFVNESETCTAFVDSNEKFIVGEVLWSSDQQIDEYLYQQIVFKVFRKPKKLISHIQRIYFTYSRNMAEQLYAALIDFLWVLDGNGKDLSQRMVASTHALLTERQAELLDNYLRQGNISLLSGNKFSVFTTGMIGTSQILTEQSSDEIIHDPLVIARDYIEYSQLEAAIGILETGVLESPERQELQTELLELYKVTKNISAFTNMRNTLMEKKLTLSAEWLELSEYFVGLSNE